MNAQLVELWLPFKGRYRIALSIPFNDCQRFALYPLAWLSYVAYTIYGCNGYLSTSADGPKVDCHADTIQPGTQYFYISQDPCLLDPCLMEDRTSFASTITTHQGDFQQRVVDRDATCILTGSAEGLQACYIVPHTKGDEYMVNFVRNRPEEIVDPPLDGINDTRNGILLHSAFHPAFGKSSVAFLHTPNIVMDVNDVDHVQQPNFNQVHAQSHPEEKRLTFQHFNTHDPVVKTMAPHNCDARLSDGVDWPSDLIFDAAYGIAALNMWGTARFISFIQESTKAIYYSGDNGGNGNEGDRGGGGLSGDKSGHAERAARRAKGKSVGRQVGNTTQSPDLYDLLLGIWMHNNPGKDQHKAHSVKAERTRKRVQTWLSTL